MAWTPGALTGLLFLAAGILALLGASGLRRRGREAAPFIVLMSTVATWAALYGIQLGFTTAPAQIPWQAAALAVSGLVPAALLAFAADYAGKWDHIAGWPLRLISGEAAVFGVLSVTNPWHNLIWTQASLQVYPSARILNLDFGVGYYLHIVIAYLIVAGALWAILSVYFRSASIYRNQSLLLLAGAVPAFAGHILWTLKASPLAGLDLTPFAFVITGGTFGAALYHFDLLDRTPVAQRHALELTGDGLMVVDSAGRIVDSNRIARQLFELDPDSSTPISTIADGDGTCALAGDTITGSVDGIRRTYDIYVTELSPNTDAQAGYAIVLRDVTEREAYEERLEIAYRVLRHNLRNDMNVILGRAEILEDLATTEEQAGHAAQIQSTGDGLVALSEKARQLVALDSGDQGNPETVNAVSVLEEVLQQFRADYPEVPVTVDCPDEAPASVVSQEALSVALENILENAPEHNETETLSVEVDITTHSNETRIQIHDTGDGLPEHEQEVLQNRSETPLQHSKGIGLWLTAWITDHSGGELAVEASPTTGTTITLVFPRG